MPGFDGTGPQGQGRMTGRGMGYCTSYIPRASSPDINPRAVYGGRGAGVGRGAFSGRGNFAGRRTPGTGGRGQGASYNRPANTADSEKSEIDELKDKLDDLVQKVEDIRK